MAESTFKRVSDWNHRGNKQPVEIGTEEYWDSLRNQIHRIQEELDEALEAVIAQDLVEVLDAGCDLDVTVAGFNYLSGMDYQKAINRVLDNNDLKFAKNDPTVLILHSERYSAKGMMCELQPSVDRNGEDIYYSIHRNKDDKIMKPFGHPRVSLEDLVPYSLKEGKEGGE